MCLYVGRSTYDGVIKLRFGLMAAMLTVVCSIDFSGAQKSSSLNESDVIVRLGYGMVASKLKSICVVNGYWSHAYHFKLPDRSIKRSYRPMFNSSNCDSECSQIAALQSAAGNLTQVMRDSIVRSINHVYTLTGRMKPLGISRRIRRKTNILGYAVSWISGLPTDDDLGEIRQVLRGIKEASDLTASDSSRTRQEMASFAKIANERINDLHKVVDLELASMNRMKDYVRTISSGVNMDQKAMVYLMQELSEFTRVRESISDIETGVQDLINGFLSPKLIEIEPLRALLMSIASKLKNEGKRLCYETTSDVYTSRTFSFLRQQNDLVIQIKLPYSQYGKLDFLRTRIFSHPVAGKQRFVMTLSGFPKYLITDVSTTLIGEVSEIPTTKLIESESVSWHRPDSKSCVFEVMRDNAHLVQEACQFTVRQADILPAYAKIAQDTFVLSNVSRVQTVCNGEPDTCVAFCQLCLAKINCNCTLSTSQWTLTAEARGCLHRKLSSASVLHAVNVPLLRQFYDLSNLSISGKDLFAANNTLKLAPITWNIFADNVSTILAGDTQKSYSLGQIAKSLASNSNVILHNPSDALLFQLFEKQYASDSFFHLNVFNWATWTIIILCLGFVSITVSGYRMHCKLKVLLALAASGNIPLARADGREFQHVVNVQTVKPEFDQSLSFLMAVVNELRYTDILLFLLLLLALALFMVGVSLVLKRALSRRTRLYLEIRNGLHALHVRILALPDGMRFYSIKAPKAPIMLEIKNYLLFAVLTITVDQWRIKNTLTKARLSVPRRILLTPCVALKLQRIICAGSYTVQPLLIHNHEFNYLPRPTTRLAEQSTAIVSP